jgi:hypothetical protein
MENPAGKSLQRGRAVPGLEADLPFFISSFMQQKSLSKWKVKGRRAKLPYTETACIFFVRF